MAKTHDDFLYTGTGRAIGKEQIYALLVDSDRNPVLDASGNEQLVDLEVVEGRLQTDASIVGSLANGDPSNGGISFEQDTNSQNVLRIVNAAPSAYDEGSDTIKISYSDLLEYLKNGNGSTAAIIRTMVNLKNLKFLYPMQEIGNSAEGAIISDFSRYEVAIGVGTNIRFNKPGPNANIIRAIDFRNSGYIVLPISGISVNSYSACTFVGVIEVPSTVPSEQVVYHESVADDITKGRLSVRITTDKKLKILTRSGLATQTASTKISDGALADGFHMIAATVDIANDEVLLYVDGVVVASGGTIDYGSDTAFPSATPITNPYIGANSQSSGVPLPAYAGRAAFFGMYSEKLTADQILSIAQAGGFAS